MSKYKTHSALGKGASAEYPICKSDNFRIRIKVTVIPIDNKILDN